MRKQPTDATLLRNALLLAGFWPQSENLIFNDRNKGGSRRLKLCFDNGIQNAPLAQQQLLWNNMLELFGDRIKEVRFSQAVNKKSIDWFRRYYGMCVYLKG